MVGSASRNYYTWGTGVGPKPWNLPMTSNIRWWTWGQSIILCSSDSTNILNSFIPFLHVPQFCTPSPSCWLTKYDLGCLVPLSIGGPWLDRTIREYVICSHTALHSAVGALILNYNGCLFACASAQWKRTSLKAKIWSHHNYDPESHISLAHI